MKKLIWIVALSSIASFGAGVDIYGNNITTNTLLGNVDGENTKIGDINNLKTESDPTVPGWAKAQEKPTYTAAEVGARPNNWMPNAQAVGALPDNEYALKGNASFSNAVVETSGIVAERLSRMSKDAELDAKIGTKQTNLVSGVNIKTVNGSSLLGSGNIEIQGGGGGGGGPWNTNAVIQSVIDRNIETNHVAAATMPPWLVNPEGRSEGQIGKTIEYYENGKYYKWGVDYASKAAYAKDAAGADKSYSMHVGGGYGPYPWKLEFDGSVFNDCNGRLLAKKLNPITSAVEGVKTNAWMTDVETLQTQLNNLAAHKQNIIQIPTAAMMEAGDRTYDDIVQYVGATTANYHFGYFYKMRTYSPRAWDVVTPVDLSGYVPTSRTVNGKSLSSNVSLTYSDVGAKNNFTVGNGLTETPADSLYAWRYYYYNQSFEEYYTKSATPSAGSRLYNSDGSYHGQEWFIVTAYNSANNTISIQDYASTIVAQRWASDDIPANPVISVIDGYGFPANGLVLTNNSVKTKSGSDVTGENVKIAAGDNTTVKGAIDSTQAIVQTWESFLDGSNVVFSITNYISGAYNLGTAKMRILEMRNGTYNEVYNSRDEILLHINDFSNGYVRVSIENLAAAVAAQIAGKADKDWGKYTSSGGEAPSNTVYMTSPNTVFAGGMEYERVAVGLGSVCVLTTKGAPTYTQGDEGTFKFQDDGGTNYFGFAKTDSYTLGCNTDGITVTANIVTLLYEVTMSVTPCIWYKQSLEDNTPWEQLNTPDGQPIPGASKVVTWDDDPDPGTKVCYLNCSETSGFFKATVEMAGSAKFMTNMPADLQRGIICTNTSTSVNGIIKPTYNGSSVQWTWSAE